MTDDREAVELQAAFEHEISMAHSEALEMNDDEFWSAEAEEHRKINAAQESRVWVEWWGGASYAHSYPWEYLEVFDSLEAAKDALVDRYADGYSYKQNFDYVFRDRESNYSPSVGEDCEMWVWYSVPEEGAEHYPSGIIRLRYTDSGDVEAYVAGGE
jgi:hypothetical protein